MSVGKRVLSALGRLGIIIAVAAAFLFGLAGTIYLSFHTSEVAVPNIVGKDYLAAETALADAGLNVRKRASRPTADKPNVVLDQLPRAGVIVKVGQTVAVDISRAPKEGESVPSSTTEAPPETGQKNENQNSNSTTTANNQNNSNQNQNKKPKNTNKNANNSNNSNNSNASNRNANNRNAPNSNNTNNRNANVNRNTNTNGNGNRNVAPNSNTNRRAPTPTTTPAKPGNNTRTPQ